MIWCLKIYNCLMKTLKNILKFIFEEIFINICQHVFSTIFNYPVNSFVFDGVNIINILLQVIRNSKI